MKKAEAPLTHFASPPCLAGEIAPDYFDPLAVDPQQALDVERWRKAERTALLAARSALGVAERQQVAGAMGIHLDTLLGRIFPEIAGKIVSGYWPIKSEPDLRPWMIRLQGRGAQLALPVVEIRQHPLTFRPWENGAKMERGHWNIPVPVTTETVMPDIALAPLVGWDLEGFRLGYGGGYFDRTLAAASVRPFTIGVGLQSALVPTIFPQPHDIRLDAIVTEDGVQWTNSIALHSRIADGNA